MSRPNAAYNIANRLEPFFDDWLIDHMDNVVLRLHHPVVREVALEFDRPWEGNTSTFVSIFQDGVTWRMYYRGSSNERGMSKHNHTCHAESHDGIHWKRSRVGMYEFNGSKDNNIVWPGPHDLDKGRPIDDFFAFKDDNPNTPDSERYKGVCNVSWRVWGGGIWGFVSPDGLRWRQAQDTPLLTDDKEYDGPQGPAFWDPFRQVYRAYLRCWETANGKEVPKLHHVPEELYETLDNPEAHRGGQWRTFRVATSKDFFHWSKPEVVKFDLPLSLEEQFYTNGVQPYFRAPHIYIGLPKRFAPFRRKFPELTWGGLSEACFVTSRDGKNWKRWPEAFIRPGLDEKNWVDRNTMPAAGIIQTSPEEISLFWTEHYRQDDCRLRRGTLRTDGFVSVNAGYTGGEFVTRPLMFEGRQLVINFSTSVIGSIQVEVQHERGSHIEGLGLADCPIICDDEIEHVVKWKNVRDLSALAGQPVKLRFAMKDADLYSIRFV